MPLKPFNFATAQKTRGGGGQKPLSARLFYDNSRPSLSENVQEPTRRRIIFSIALFPIAASVLFLFRLTKSKRTFYAQIESLCFHTGSGIKSGSRSQG